MVAKSKLYSKLDGLEIELKERLVPHLEQAAAGNNDLVFCVKAILWTLFRYRANSHDI
jgi:hypothetical protein